MLDKNKVFEPVAVLRSFLKKHPPERSAVCALSGGADSVCLLYAMVEVGSELGLSISAIHINHGIRGVAADADEEFCLELCSKLGIPIAVERVDAPAYAKKKRMSLESAARELRYQAFEGHAAALGGASILLAHNATDQAETVLFRMARGTGLCGLCGIPPQRGKFLRPFLTVESGDIRSYLDGAGIAYRVDATNLDTKYTRNRIRQEIVPQLEAVHSGAVRHISYMTDGLREDEGYLMDIASTLLSRSPQYRLREVLKNSHPAVAKRMIRILHSNAGASRDAISAEALDDIYQLICSDTEYSTVSITGDRYAVIDREHFYITRDLDGVALASYILQIGENIDQSRDCLILLSRTEIDIKTIPLPNVYNLVTVTTLAFDKIKGNLYVRSRKEGDAYTYGGMTHRVKTLFTDAKMARYDRAHTPIVCDDMGIVWIPGFGVRDSCKRLEGDIPLYLYYLSRPEVTFDER